MFAQVTKGKVEKVKKICQKRLERPKKNQKNKWQNKP